MPVQLLKNSKVSAEIVMHKFAFTTWGREDCYGERIGDERRVKSCKLKETDNHTGIAAFNPTSGIWG